MKKILAFICFALLIANSYAQTPKDHINRFFKMHKEVGFDQAVDTLFISSKWLSQRKDDKDRIKLKLSKFEDELEEYYEHELLTAQGMGTCLEYYTYLMMYERHPLRIHFAFYKSKGKWILHAFKYDDQLVEELEKSAISEPVYNINKKKLK